MLSGNLFKGDLRPVLQTFTVALLHGVHMLLERRGFFQRMAQIEPDDA